MPPEDIRLTPVHAAPQQIVVQQPTMFGRFGRWMFAALVMMLFALIGMYGKYQGYFSPADAPQEKYHSLAKQASKKIAIITVDGAIMTAEDGFIKRQIDRIRE